MAKASLSRLKAVLTENLRALAVNFNGQKVLVAPNLCGPGSLPHRYSLTSPDIINACVQLARVGGAASVTVANHAADFVENTGAFYTALGLDFPGFDFVDLRHRPFQEVDGLRLTELLNRADLIINLALPKTHHQADGVTLGLKNLALGLATDRRQMHQSGLGEAIVKANQLIRQRTRVIDIIDGRFGQQGRGPHFGDAVEPGFMIFGTENPVGVDATAARLMGFDPFLIRTFVLAQEAGLGTLTPAVAGDIARIEVTNFTRSSDWHLITLPDHHAVVFWLEAEGQGRLRLYALDQEEQIYKPVKTQVVNFSPDTTGAEAYAFVSNDANLEAILASRDVFSANNYVQFFSTVRSGVPSRPGLSEPPKKAVQALVRWLDANRVTEKSELDIRVVPDNTKPGGSAALHCQLPALPGQYGQGQYLEDIPGTRPLAEFLAQNKIGSIVLKRGASSQHFLSGLEAELRR